MKKISSREFMNQPLRDLRMTITLVSNFRRRLGVLEGHLRAKLGGMIERKGAKRQRRDRHTGD